MPTWAHAQGLKREIMLLMMLRHRHVLRAVAFGADVDLIPFMVVERLQTTLAHVLPGSPENTPVWVQARERRQWPLSRALDCGLQLARALAYCHDSAIEGYRVLHRDIKPKNVSSRTPPPRPGQLPRTLSLHSAAPLTALYTSLRCTQLHGKRPIRRPSTLSLHHPFPAPAPLGRCPSPRSSLSTRFSNVPLSIPPSQAAPTNCAHARAPRVRPTVSDRSRAFRLASRTSEGYTAPTARGIISCYSTLASSIFGGVAQWR